MAVTMSLGGQSAGANNERSLFLKVFSGEVLNAYERAIKVSALLTTRTISNGKSAQFPTTGLALARYFTQGSSLFDDNSADGNAMLSQIKQSERIIYVDNLLTASCFIDQLDEAISHYDYRSAFATELGRALARHQDNLAWHTLTAAALDHGTVANEHTPGAKNDIIDATLFYTNPSNAVNAIYAASQVLDEVDVPKEDRVVLMPPIAYYNLLKAGVLSIGAHAVSDTRGLHADTGVRGEVSGTMVAGMPVVVTNCDGWASSDTAEDAGGTAGFTDSKVPSPGAAEDQGIRNLIAPGGTPDGDDGDAIAAMDANTACLVFHKAAAGIVKLRDITMESEYIIERQGTLMVAKMAQGMGALRNDAIVLIKTDAD
jgi:hypothetical protein